MTGGKFIFFLGSDHEIQKHYLPLMRRNYPDLVPMQVSYEKRLSKVDEDQFLKLERGKELVVINRLIGKGKLVGVVNRVDSYIPLQGMLVDEFGLDGPSYESVIKLKNKLEMDNLVRGIGCEQYRPMTESVGLDELAFHLESARLPVVVKPYMGSKSRGVMVVNGRDEIGNVINRLDQHFESEKMFRTEESKRLVLVEEYVEGKQVTYTGYVDSKGILRTVGFEDVLTGKDVGQRHQQLVYRTNPSMWVGEVKGQIVKMLRKLVQSAGLQSTFIFPEFKVTGKQAILIELNVRIGGYRSEMYKYAYGMDIWKMNVDLALGKGIRELKKYERRCKAIDVWRDESGVVKQIEIPDREDVRDGYIYFKKGMQYIAPPKEQQPIARFYVVDEKDSLGRARELYKQVRVQLG